MNETTEPHNGDRSRRKYVFVGGSPRSGTSLLGRNIARMEDCTGLKNTGVFEDLGQFLQDVYPTASAYGSSSRCGFDPRMHRTQTSDLLAPEKVARLRATWHSDWDNSKSHLCGENSGKLPDDAIFASSFPQFVFCRDHVVRCIAFWQISAPLRGALRCAPGRTQSGRPKDFC